MQQVIRGLMVVVSIGMCGQSTINNSKRKGKTSGYELMEYST